MKKEHLTYGILGLFAGLILGFFVANWTAQPSGASAVPSQTAQNPQSVNSGGQSSDLPPGHPPVDPNKPVQAGPLPSGAGGSQPSPSMGSSAQAPSLMPEPGSSEKPAEQVLKNIKVLKGVPASRVTTIMQYFNAALGVDCTYCHVSAAEPEKDHPKKTIAIEWIRYVQQENKKRNSTSAFNCMMCHNGQPRPAGQ